jgi:DHA2 family lincomycin resistance protein-like MFS transporter
VLAIGVVCLPLRVAADPAAAVRRPAADLRAFKFKMFGISVALLCIAMMALFGALILL